ncbi:tRNA (adenosine(37)-N6)-threonylcarbamoyltransferase complex ATPase subunit type 1 TsaE [Roseofilum casamattae]|uniref:tRNA threonylcarbamoyladenosine biosynthesis protein TsaE n=1 Tax=Roseofilum casamattae BLCC-M143 TaxID=3022442 RepID=A0ABT7BW26_9CYAN|nr:tRNA (adenosine(37)-N6)-threonylcarbamoyltransferase complex ATPase subunit type 1 TsaE [Roseofilum casamattae]MDJ1182661.1 tRNA (adenosine(37)-N6)-threonylcarbamoyltransferase complex ATPase subunit type 1 TsaE [Roseofilum casamattae BLCC-M143]
MSLILDLHDAEATQTLGFQLGQLLVPGSNLLLNGDLGAGKTTFVQGLGRGLGIAEGIDSPTFTLLNEYLQGRVPLYHFDLYRLDPSEVAGLNPELYWEGIEVSPGIVAIEWAEKLPYSPPEFLILELSHRDDSRQAQFFAKGKQSLQMLEAIAECL